jgi:hypothetical protein
VNWDVSIALKHALVGVGSTYDSSRVRILLSISSPSTYHMKCCKDGPIWLNYSLSFSSLGIHCAHAFWNFKRSCIMLYAKTWEQPSAVATSVVILMLAWICCSTCCTVASVAVWTELHGQASSATLEHAWENFLAQVWTALIVNCEMCCAAEKFRSKNVSWNPNNFGQIQFKIDL